VIIGDTDVFAIESQITRAYARLSLRGLGFFVVHIGGYRFGVHAPEATALACSFDTVKERIDHRGEHIAELSSEPDASLIARAVRLALYTPNQEEQQFFGLSGSQLSDVIYSRRLLWAPDGDAAFDDGSKILQFDIDDRVRLIAFRLDDGSNGSGVSSLREVSISAETFYGLLRMWHHAFEEEWKAAPKVAEQEA